MTSFEDIRGAMSRTPFFHVLYAGADSDRAARLHSAVEERTELRLFRQATSIQEAAAVLGEQNLRVGLFEGCLLVVWDLGNLTGAEIRDWLSGLPEWPSGQVAAFLVTEGSPEISFREFIGLVGRDFVGLGDFGACINHVSRWSSPEGSPDLGLPFCKRPSVWLRNLKHDYFSNAVLPYRDKFENLGILSAQREIDLIGSVLRNLLCPSDAKIAVRALPAESEEEESNLYQRIYSLPVRIVAPAHLANLLAVEYTEGSDFVLYQTIASVTKLLDDAAQDGCACVLLRPWESGRLGVTAGPGVLPSVLVDEAAPRLEWREWQSLLAENVIGSYGEAELENRRSGKPVLVAQRPYWRACAVLSLPALFDCLIEHLEETYTTVDQSIPKLRDQVFRSLAAVVSARTLYLGQPGTGNSP